MKVEIRLFSDQTEAQNYADTHGSQCSPYHGPGGAIIRDMGGFGFTGDTNRPVWVVIAQLQAYLNPAENLQQKSKKPSPV